MKEDSKKAKTGLVISALLLAALCVAAGVFALVRQQRAAEKQRTLEEAVASLSLPEAGEAQTEAGRLLAAAWTSVRRAAPEGELLAAEDAAEQRFALTTLDLDALGGDLAEALAAQQRAWVDAAQLRSEVYREDGRVREELLEAALPTLLEELLTASDYARGNSFTLHLRYGDGQWVRENEQELNARLLGALSDPDTAAQALLERAAESLSYLPLHYTISEDALSAPAPNPAGFGETDDPAVIEALLLSEDARRLIGGQTPVWNAELERFPGSSIRWYLDETILVLVWQEVEHGGVGTFSEVFLADGSQIRRKISADQLYDLHFETASRFAREANAVLASGGDMYYHGRMCGIGFYQRELYRFEPDSCDTCYITADGDLLFSYRGEITDEEAARRFGEDNDVVFSLVFGPVLIDGGVNVTPQYYAWGQVNDEYARAALGQLGRLHYLTMNLNCGTGRYYHLFTLRQAAESMLARGCEKAYTLDGGQTAVTIWNGQLVNPVQFGWERQVSDILYFATAIPEE